MGPIGVAVNGVVFFNPYDRRPLGCLQHHGPLLRARIRTASTIITSTFTFASIPLGRRRRPRTPPPLIGWAFDGFPIYGPYEVKDLHGQR